MPDDQIGQNIPYVETKEKLGSREQQISQFYRDTQSFRESHKEIKNNFCQINLIPFLTDNWECLDIESLTATKQLEKLHTIF